MIVVLNELYQNIKYIYLISDLPAFTQAV